MAIRNKITRHYQKLNYFGKFSPKSYPTEVIVSKRLLNYVMQQTSNPVFSVKRDCLLSEGDTGYLEHLVDQEYAIKKELELHDNELDEDHGENRSTCREESKVNP